MDEKHATPTPTEIAWAAGLFEGEGCLNAYLRPPRKHGTQRWGMQVRLSMTDQDAVERFAKIVGCGNVGVRDSPYNRDRGHKQLYNWYVQSANEVIRVIELLLPWLCERRTARAHEVLAVAREILVNNADKTHCPKGHELSGENLMLEPIKRKMADGSVREYTARRCKVCRYEQMRRNYVARREGAANG